MPPGRTRTPTGAGTLMARERHGDRVLSRLDLQRTGRHTAARDPLHRATPSRPRGAESISISPAREAEYARTPKKPAAHSATITLMIATRPTAYRARPRARSTQAARDRAPSARRLARRGVDLHRLWHGHRPAQLGQEVGGEGVSSRYIARRPLRRERGRAVGVVDAGHGRTPCDRAVHAQRGARRGVARARLGERRELLLRIASSPCRLRQMRRATRRCPSASSRATRDAPTPPETDG